MKPIPPQGYNIVDIGGGAHQDKATAGETFLPPLLILTSGVVQLFFCGSLP